MGKKIWYSKPLARQWDLYLKSYKHHKETIEQFFQKMLKQSSSNPFQSWQNSQLNTFVWSLWYSDASKKLLHLYFADRSLKEFLENVPLADLEGIGKYIDENGLITEQGFLQLKYFPFGIHIPYENKYKAFAFGLMNNQINQMVLSWTVENGGAWCSEMNYKELLEKVTDEAKEITKIFRLAINTIAYMEAFPECVKEGVPELLKEEFSENSFTLEIAEKVLEPIKKSEDGKMVSPHFRKGYYKRLSSDFYKNKKGQIIFVSETMVNGKAKTIYTTEKIKDIDSLDIKEST
jgi:hypothetical protein